MLVCCIFPILVGMVGGSCMFLCRSIRVAFARLENLEALVMDVGLGAERGAAAVLGWKEMKTSTVTNPFKNTSGTSRSLAIGHQRLHT